MRAIGGLITATLLGIGVACVTTRYVRCALAFDPVAEFIRPLPPAAIIPLSIFFFGLRWQLYAFIVIFACFWPVYLNAARAMHATPLLQVQTARSFGYCGWSLVINVQLAAALPDIFIGIRQAGAISLIATIVTEMLAGQSGLGFFITDATMTLQIPESFAALLVIMLDGILIDTGIHCVTPSPDRLARGLFRGEGLMRINWYAFVFGCALLAGWEIGARVFGGGFFPSLSQTLVAFYVNASGIMSQIGFTLLRAGAALGLDIVLMIPLGILIGRSALVARFIEPVIALLRPLPPPAVAPLVILFAGIGSGAKIAIIAYASAFPILLNTIDGVRASNPDADLCRALAASDAAGDDVVYQSAGGAAGDFRRDQARCQRGAAGLGGVRDAADHQRYRRLYPEQPGAFQDG